ncbi:sugar ABC transporter substrate-binding protein [Rhizobium leguminosarum bv. trifolii]|uniref:Sugar ABC transporter substrate-binding protein n=1 Tax=Rhizobium leguminosarum bv. trifolii TaxID=386 RepID=A0A3E1B6E9_RHILT|nr:substrate-binding domain-containing protein [Rhizobium leguminosarum]RFB86497.1 sugar ABC transporter substrate-binding protein [Rhizobium leguminosarum bv. trifolii]RFB86757.1 sugar ABC transporter substrate-binding protein [Rhizobium leguminosarum bv. trifolii]
MSILKKFSYALTAAAVMGATAHAEDKQYLVGVNSFGESAEYAHTLTQEIQEHPWVKDGKVKIVVFDGKFDSLLQSNAIDTMITQKFDAIIMESFDKDGSAAPIEKAIDAGIPVIGSALETSSEKITSQVIVDDPLGGKMIGDFMAERLKGQGNIVILEGPIGQSAQISRRQGIDASLAANTGIKLIASKSANWSRAEGQAVMENWLSAYSGQINGVLSENDEMALGAIEAIKSAGLDPKDIPVIGIDGIPDGKRAVQSGEMYMSLYKYAKAEGQGALDLALRQLVGEKYEPQSEIWKSLKIDWAGGTSKHYTVPWLVLNHENIGKYID